VPALGIHSTHSQNTWLGSWVANAAASWRVSNSRYDHNVSAMKFLQREAVAAMRYRLYE